MHRPHSTQETVRADDIDRMVEGSNQFALDAWKHLARGGLRNLVFSPSGLSSALAMAYAGAAHETADELARVLHTTLPAASLGAAIRALHRRAADDGVDLRIVNRLWGQSGYSFLPDFLRLTEQRFGAALAEVDFAGDPPGSCQKINRWIEQLTAGRIRDLISPRSLGPLTRLILTNAVYFLGRWWQPFSERLTSDEEFWTASNTSRRVPTMHQTGIHNYGEFPGLQVLEIEYRPSRFGSDVWSRRSELSMCFLLPTERDGLEKIESQLSMATLRRWTSLDSAFVDVSLPRFRFTSDLPLTPVLSEMGLARAFSPEAADFSKITDDPEGLFLAEVVHRAFIDVNEKGTEAAAASTASAGGCGSMPPQPRPFRADHPFLFVLGDRGTGMIHFLGRVANPTG